MEKQARIFFVSRVSACCFLLCAFCFLLFASGLLPSALVFCLLLSACCFLFLAFLLSAFSFMRLPFLRSACCFLFLAACDLLCAPCFLICSFLCLVDCTEPQDRCYLRLLFFACSCLVLAVFHHVSHCFINSSGDQNPPGLEQTGAFRNNAWRKQSVVFRKVS